MLTYRAICPACDARVSRWALYHLRHCHTCRLPFLKTTTRGGKWFSATFVGLAITIQLLALALLGAGWAVMAGFTTIGIFLAIAAFAEPYILMLRRDSRCPACGYDTRATPHRCPECGHEARRAETAA